MDCEVCGEVDSMPYTCSRCDDHFCVKHRLPEQHDCVILDVEKAMRKWYREEGSEVPWFKDEFDLSNVAEETVQFDPVETEIQPEAADLPEDRYLEAQATHQCWKCGEKLFSHSAVQCRYCGEVFCESHASAHLGSCSELPDPLEESTRSVGYAEQKRKSEELRKAAKRAEKKKQPDYEPTPDVGVDGSLVYPEDQDTDNAETDDELPDTPTGSLYVYILILALLVGLAASAFFLLL